MLLVLWVIRLLNGADITPGGQGVGFDCVIEFCFFSLPSFLLPRLFLLPVPSSSSSSSCSSFSGRKLEGRFSCRGWSLGSRTVPSVPVGSQAFFFSLFFFFTSGSPWRPLSRKTRARVSAYVSVCVFVFSQSVCTCTCTPRSVCAPVCHVLLRLCCHLQPDKPKDLSPGELPLSGG